MPKRSDNIETRIFDYFRGSEMDQAKLVFSVVKDIMRKREKNHRLLTPEKEAFKVERTA